MRIKLALAAIFLPILLAAQEKISVRGKIVDEKGNPVEYVQVGVPERHIGTISTVDGQFEISVPIDTLEFKHPAFLDDIVTIEAWVTHVERTSMEVRVDTYAEDPTTEERRMINHAYLTEVCVDANGHPVPVPWGLVATTDEQHKECIAARRRAEMRKIRRAEGF